MDVHLVDGTYELFRHYYALPSARDAGRPGGRRRARRARVRARHDPRRRHPRGRRHRSRHRVVPQPAVARLQDRRAASSRTCSRQFPLLEDALSAMGVVVWPMVEFEADDALASAAVGGRTRCARRSRDHLHARQGSRPVRARHARRADESPNAQHSGRGRRRRPSSASRRRRSPTTWLSWATRRTAIRACRAGARNPRPRFSPASAISKPSRRLAHLARERLQARACSPTRWRASATGRCCFARSPRFAPTSRCSIPSIDLQWKGPTPAFAPLSARLDAAVSDAIPRRAKASRPVGDIELGR